MFSVGVLLLHPHIAVMMGRRRISMRVLCFIVVYNGDGWFLLYFLKYFFLLGEEGL